MATITKRNNPYSVVYKYFDENGKHHQKWETFNTNQEAKRRKREVGYAMQSKTFIIPTANTISDIYKLLNSVFNQAVKWEMAAKNPIPNATLPKLERQRRKIWTVETMVKALELCDDEILSSAINLSFSCCLRIGEMLGLTWDCINISDEAVENNEAFIYINKELQRASKKSIEDLEKKDVLMIFPSDISSKTTSLVLKLPKTKSSVRKVYLPKTVALMLKNRKQQIREMKELYGEEFNDYNLVFCYSNGSPIEGQVINRLLQNLIKKYNLPKVVFHSFRHASITYKLKWNNGDIKSVQGDSGHSRIDMIADVYSHIIDEDRRYNAEKFDEQFYHAKGIHNMEGDITVPKFNSAIETMEERKKKDDKLNLSDLAKLLENPDIAAILKNLSNHL